MTSMRRVSCELHDESFSGSLQDLARTAIEDQDSEFAQRRAKIKSITQA